jgi:hypothetical protein
MQNAECGVSPSSFPLPTGERIKERDNLKSAIRNPKYEGGGKSCYALEKI